jgi:hypothetical protein
VNFKKIMIAFITLLFVTLAFHPSQATTRKVVSCLYQIECGNFDVVLLAGQSNATSRGFSLRIKEAMTSSRIFQLGRYATDYEIIPAKEPLSNLIPEGVTRAINGIGFALSFALQYEKYALKPGREILIIPAALGASAALGENAYWRKGGPGEQDVNDRLSSILLKGNGNKLVAIIWHQGESDSGKDLLVYHAWISELLTGIRSRFGTEDTPIILGELTPSLINWSKAASQFNDGLHELVASMPYAGLALSDALGSIGTKSNPSYFDRSHFTSEAQIELGKRYFCAWQRIISPRSALAENWYCKRFSEVSRPVETSWFNTFLGSAKASD